VIASGLAKVDKRADYSYITEDKFKLGGDGALLCCVSGMGPHNHPDLSLSLGGWYFQGKKLKVSNVCHSTFAQFSEGIDIYPGLVSFRPCGPLSPDEEGVYSCMMKNSSMMVDTYRIGLYIKGRSKSVT